MLITVSERDFHGLVIDKEDLINARLAYAPPLMSSIALRWMSELEMSSIVLLTYLITRTVGSAKAADRISVREFLSGPVNRDGSAPFKPLPMSESTLRKQVRALCDLNLITIYSVKSMSTQIENQARMFEINCKNMLDVPEMLEGREVFLAQIDLQICMEKENKTHPKTLLLPQ